jgi:hypothetical protein
MLLFLPPRIQALIGVAVIAGCLALHSLIIVAVGGVGLAVGAGRWVHARRKSAVSRAR